MLGGSDTLSEVEHRALFRELSKGHDRIQYKVSGTKTAIMLACGTLETLGAKERERERETAKTR